MNKKVLITGGFGYIGGQIACKLSQCGYTVRLTSRSKHQAPSWLPNGEVTTLDLTNKHSIAEALKNIDVIIHLAAMNEIECLNNPALAIKINTIGSLNLLDEAIKYNVKKIIYFSTIHIYGSPLSGVINENTLPNPNHPYAITHKSAEEFLLSRKEQIDITIFRLSNSFGAPTHNNINRWSLLVNDVCKQIIETGKIVLKSTGDQLRDFITLDDVARATIHILETNNNGVYNLGGETTLSIYDMVKLIAARAENLLGVTPKIIRPTSNKKSIIEDLSYEVNKLKKTNFILNKNIKSAIDETLEFLNNHT